MKKFIMIYLFMPGIIAMQGQVTQIDPGYIVDHFTDSTGQEIIGIVVPGKPPDDFRMPPAEPTESSFTLSHVPGYDWSFGCSATSAAMMAGFYDRTGYTNMYSGPTNGGVAPLDNSVWGSVVINGETRKLCPISATRDGLDGRSIYGHVDDYWISYGNTNPDPYITNNWPQHAWGDCTGDYMKTNQSFHQNTDGSTTFWYYTNGNPYSGNGSNNDGMYGLKQFFESQGYTVTGYYNQYIYGYNGNTLGFTFTQYKQQIDAGRPVLIQVQGHTMLGIGYNETGNIVYLRDTWDYISHQMTWGGTYSTMQHYAVCVIQLESLCIPFQNSALSSNGGIATAISEGTYLGNTQYAYLANDGDENSFWASQWSMPAWLEIEFDQVYNIDTIGVWWGSHQHNFTLSLSLDSSIWTGVYSGTSNNFEGSDPVHELFSIPSTYAKYMKIDITSTSAPSSHIFQAIVCELEAYTVNPLPGEAGPISGPIQVHQGETGVEYSIPFISQATSYSWSVPTGVTITSTSNNDTIIVDFGLTAQSGNIIVYGTNDCGDGVADTLAIVVGYDISGPFYYNNSGNTTLDSLRIFLFDNEIKIDSTNTDANGEYLFTEISPGTYTITATTGKTWAGVNATDAIKIQRHFVGIESLIEPVRIQAGDVNNSGNINGTDAIKLKRRFVGMDTSFARGDWTFAKPIVGGDTIIVQDENVVQNFFGLCVGDVNGSYTPGPGLNLPAGNLMTYQEPLQVQSGQRFKLPLFLDRSMPVSAISLVLEIPADLLEVTDVEVNHGTVLFQQTKEALRIAWSEIDPLDVTVGDTLITLHLQACQNLVSESWIYPILLPESELADMNAKVILVITLGISPIHLMPDDRIPDAGYRIPDGMKVIPNPNDGTFRIQLDRAEDQSFELKLIDSRGSELVKSQEVSISGGVSSQVSFNELAPGIYIVKLNNETTEYKGKLIIK